MFSNLQLHKNLNAYNKLIILTKCFLILPKFGVLKKQNSKKRDYSTLKWLNLVSQVILTHKN